MFKAFREQISLLYEQKRFAYRIRKHNRFLKKANIELGRLNKSFDAMNCRFNRLIDAAERSINGEDFKNGR